MKKHSLKVSLYYVFTGSVFMPFIIISLIISYFFHNQLLDNYKINNQIILQTLSNYLDSSIQDSERFFFLYLFDTNVSRFYRSVNKNEINDSQESLYKYVRDSARYRISLNNYLTMFNSYYKGIGFIPENANKNSCFYLQRYESNIIWYQNEDMDTEKWYQEMINLPLGKALFLPESIMKGCGEYQDAEDVFCMLRVTNHLETASRQGYTFLELSDTIFSNLAKEVSLPAGAGLAIYFPDGTPAYATDDKFMFDKNALGELTDVEGKRVKINGGSYYAYSMKEEQYGFLICYLLPQSIVWKQANETYLSILLIWFCSIIISFVIFAGLSKRISISTGRIMEYIKKYRLGDEKKERNLLPEMSIAEFDNISAALTEMTDKITNLVEHEYIWKINQQMAEYKAMQAEINPHFFNNVMNSLLALNRIGEKENLEKGILNLSRMFRYTCEHGYESTIEKECHFIESYLILEKVRFEERLHYQISIEEGLREFPIPKLLLQPVVENAIRHGMPRDGGCIKLLLQVCGVSDRSGKKYIWIMIANNGTPYREKELYLEGRVGIRSVKERLMITYPDSLFWYDRKGEFQTVCNMLIPVT
ncbi:sensor histidine kinase [Parablautia intestinalis]|uniref:sensor histidine kinase n=1 Tax=Parablautia intestinalis TaxID=2320100 RepID=UPI00256F345A|nr:histidine kinase [Parablautia intestinalis]